jgi:hypothetical protein
MTGDPSDRGYFMLTRATNGRGFLNASNAVTLVAICYQG